MSTEILAKAVGTANTLPFIVAKGYPETISAYPKANMGTDVGKLVKKNPDGTWDPVTDSSDAEVELKDAHMQIIVDGNGTFRIEFAARAAAIGVTKERL